MIEPQNLIEIIHNGLDNLADSDKMSVKYEIKESSTSVSLYIYKKIPSTRELYILRISDHLPSMQKLVRGDDEPRPSVDENANVSIDFYKPKRIRRVNATTGEVNIKKVPNKFDNYVGVPASIPQVEPFTVSSYEYFYKNLEQGDEMILWHSIASWVCCLSPNKEYHDPFASDEKKRAKTEVKTAEVHVFGDKAEIITENKRYQKMNRINEIGDTPRGQYMLGRLSQSYDEPKIYSDDYDEKPEIASYASDNWHKYGRGDDNENAFNLGRGDEEGVRWIDDGSQRRFRERHGLPQMNRQLHKESRHTDMNRKLIRLTESDLHRIVKESVDKILKEMNLNPNPRINSFDAHGRGLTSKSHMPNSPRRRAAKLQQNINDVKIDTNAIARQLYPDHTPQMAKDQLKRKLYGESSNQFLKEDVDYGMPPYTVVVGGLREGQPFDDIYDAIEYAEQWHNYITNSGEHENITIYDGNDEDVWSVGHFRK